MSAITALTKVTSSTLLADEGPQQVPAFQDLSRPSGYATRTPPLGAVLSSPVPASCWAAVMVHPCRESSSGRGPAGSTAGTNSRYERATPLTFSETTLVVPTEPPGAAPVETIVLA